MDISMIKHVVVLTMENRSFDHVFGGLREEGVAISVADRDKWTNDDRNGRTHGITELDDTLASVFEPDPHHGWQAVEKQIQNGTMGGFVKDWVDAYRNKASPRNAVMSYLTRRHQPVSYFFAEEYTVLERYFPSIATGTLPNRFYGMCGDSAGHADNAVRKQLLLKLKTIFTNIPADTWRVYAGALPTLAMIGGIAEKQRNLKNVRRLSRFFDDAAAGTLPKLSWLEPIYSWSSSLLSRLVGIPDGPPNDDHPPSHTARGQKLFHDVYSALIADADRWKNTLLIIYYDEHGGFFDHVTPPRIHPDDVRADELTWMGPRVPAWLISPYARRGGRDQTQFDHCSVLKFLAEWLGVPAPGRAASPRTASIADALDDQPRGGPFPAPPAPPPQPMAPAPGTEPPADEFEQAAVSYLDRLEQEEPDTYKQLQDALRA